MTDQLIRDPAALADQHHDMLVVGGGIFGICAAWDAARRGLKVALIERGDFAQGASANCYKMIHGGIRYLQHGDLVRLRQSASERSTWLRIAPHIVRPLPIVIPTYGRGHKGKALLAAGAHLYDLLTLDRNRGMRDSDRRVPASRSLSPADVLEHFPDMETAGLTGGVLIHDAQMHSPARLAIAILRSAASAGASAANHVEATRFTIENGRVTGVEARDRLDGARFRIRARIVVNATGGWSPELLGPQRLAPAHAPAFSRDAYFIVPRAMRTDHAVAVQGATRDPDALLARPARHLFVVPWRQYTIIGVWHRVYERPADEVDVSSRELQDWIDELNGAYPALALQRSEVSLWNAGLVLFGENAPGQVHLSYGKRSRIIEHREENGTAGLYTLLGIRYTTARRDASELLDLVSRREGLGLPRADTARTPVFGGDIERMETLIDDVEQRLAGRCGGRTQAALVRNYGARFDRVLGHARGEPAEPAVLPGTDTLEAEVLHAVREEMARRLGDVVLRRTELGTGAHPGTPALERSAALMAAELGWSEATRAAEVESVQAWYRAHGPGGDGSSVSAQAAGA